MREIFNTTIKSMKQLNSIFDKTQKKYFILILFLIFISSVFELLGISALLPILQLFLDKESFGKNNIIQNIVTFLKIENENLFMFYMIIFIILVYIIKNILLIVSDYIQIKFRCSLQKKMSIDQLKRYMQYPYMFFINTDSAEIYRGITSDVAAVKNLLSTLFSLIIEILVAFFLICYLFMVDFILALGLILVSGGSFCILFSRFKSNSKELGENLRNADRKLIKNINEALGGIKEFTVMDKRRYLVDRCNYEFTQKTMTEISYLFAVSRTPRLLEIFLVIGLIFIIMFRMSTGVAIQKLIANFAIFAVAAFKILPSISKVAQAITSIGYYSPSLEAVYNKVQENVTQEKVNTQEINRIFMNKLHISNITWRYDTTENYVLKDIDMIIKKNEAVAIIGKSGSGKTTLADIILGLLQPTKGHVLMDDIDIFSMLPAWRKIVGYVPQSVYLYDDTIRKNIAFGEKRIDDDWVNEVVKQAQLEEFIKSLPKGLDTKIGERGIKLSGGQRQRISIARALYRKPQILILDEATSALDNETEAAVMDAIEKLHGNITLIIIAHRLTTIQSCDRVYEVVNGSVIEKDKSIIKNKAVIGDKE